MTHQDTDRSVSHATPLADRHAALGARMIDFAGWLMPVQYTSILEEHRAVRERVGLFDLSHMGELLVEGPEAGEALAAALVTDPPSLAVGRAHYSMICAPDGGIIDDLIVYRLADDRFMVVANAGNAAVVSDAMAERLAGTRAVLDDQSLATGLVAIQGPRSRDVLAPHTDVDLDALKYYAIAEGQVAGIPALVARTGYTGEDGFEVFVDDRAHRRAVGRPARGRPRLGGCARRAGRPRHAAPGGRHAALWQRARPDDHPVRRRPRSGGEAREVRRFRRTGGAGEGRRRGPAIVGWSGSSSKVGGSPATATRSTSATDGPGS